MNVEIKKAKIKNRLFLSYEYVVSENNIKRDCKDSSDAPIHEDLQAAFDALIPHFVLLCEEEKVDSVDEAEVERLSVGYNVTGIAIGGSDDTEGVTISGNKILQSGKAVGFNTPFQKFSDDEYYNFCEELYNSVEHLKSEVLEYMDGKQGSRAVVGTLDFDDEEEEAFALNSNDDSYEENEDEA